MLSIEEILDIAQTLGVKVQDLLRPSSPVYTERKDELYAMDDAELAAVIATEPTLIKRPIVKTQSGYVIGLDECIRRCSANKLHNEAKSHPADDHKG